MFEGGGGVGGNYVNLVENIMEFSICHQDLSKHDRKCKKTLFFIYKIGNAINQIFSLFLLLP